MRNISEQELKNILDKHGKWIRSEDGGKRANLSSADLRSANLSYANLRSADLRFADLSSADLSYANLSSANLRSADLRFANLRYADLSSADLRSADLRFANLRFANLILFQFQRHQAFYTFDGTLRIGCLALHISEWMETFEKIGLKEGYSDQQILMYGNFIKSCAHLFELNAAKIEGK